MEDTGARRAGRFVYDEVGRQLLLRTTKKGLPTFFWYGADTYESHASSMTILVGDGPARGRVAHQVTVDDTRVVGTPPPPPFHDIRGPVRSAAQRSQSSDGMGALSATSERMPSDAFYWAEMAVAHAPPGGAERRVCTSVIDFSGFAASLSATLTGVYSHQLGGTVNGVTYTSRLDQFGHFLVVPASSVLQPFGLSRRSEMQMLEDAFANIAIRTTPVLRDTTVFRVCDARGYAAVQGGRGVGVVKGEDVSVTTQKAPSWVVRSASASSDALASSIDSSSSGGMDRASSSDGTDEAGIFEKPSADAVAAFSQMFALDPAELASGC